MIFHSVLEVHIKLGPSAVKWRHPDRPLGGAETRNPFPGEKLGFAGTEPSCRPPPPAEEGEAPAHCYLAPRPPARQSAWIETSRATSVTAILARAFFGLCGNRSTGKYMLKHVHILGKATEKSWGSNWW